eukprot:gene25512-11254_t
MQSQPAATGQIPQLRQLQGYVRRIDLGQTNVWLQRYIAVASDSFSVAALTVLKQLASDPSFNSHLTEAEQKQEVFKVELTIEPDAAATLEMVKESPPKESNEEKQTDDRSTPTPPEAASAQEEGSTGRKDYKARLTAFYQHYVPNKVSSVDEALEKYA